MGKKRITDLMDLRIVEKTEKVFPEETTLLRMSLNFMRRLTEITARAVGSFDEQPNLRAVLDLFCRNRDLIHFSMVCMVNGGYPETKILSRVELENVMLIRLLNLKPDLAKDWFSDPEAFRKKWSADDIRKAVFIKIPKRCRNYSEFYWLLCDYVHPSFKGWAELMKKKGDGIYIGWHPEFNASYASGCIGLVSFISMQTMAGYLKAFKEFLSADLVMEGNRLNPKLQELLYRHFEVRVYDKKGMMTGQPR